MEGRGLFAESLDDEARDVVGYSILALQLVGFDRAFTIEDSDLVRLVGEASTCILQTIEHDGIEVLGVHLALGFFYACITLQSKANEELIRSLVLSKSCGYVGIADELQIHRFLTFALDLLAVMVARTVVGYCGCEDSDVGIPYDFFGGL